MLARVLARVMYVTSRSSIKTDGRIELFLAWEHWRCPLRGTGAHAPLNLQRFIFHASLCSYKSMKAHVKPAHYFAYHSH